MTCTAAASGKSVVKGRRLYIVACSQHLICGTLTILGYKRGSCCGQLTICCAVDARKKHLIPGAMELSTTAPGPDCLFQSRFSTATVFKDSRQGEALHGVISFQGYHLYLTGLKPAPHCLLQL